MLRKRRDLAVVTLLAVTVSTGCLYVVSVSGFAGGSSDGEPARVWQQAVAAATGAEESAGTLSSRSTQEESGRLARVVIGDGHALPRAETRVEEVDGVARCMRLATRLLTRIAGTMPRGHRGDLGAHTAELRAMCSSAPASGALEQCLGGASGAGDIAACAGAELSEEQYATYRAASDAIMSAEPELEASGDEPFRIDASYEALLNELLAQLPERERESARTLIVDSLRKHLDKERP